MTTLLTTAANTVWISISRRIKVQKTIILLVWRLMD